MDTWGVGGLGAGAYRQQFCSRTLVTQFSWIWITLLLIATFFSPVLSLVRPIRRLKALLKTGQSASQSTNETLTQGPDKFRKEAVEYRCEIVGIYMILLVIIVFGLLSPPLLILAPLFTCSKSCAINWRTLQMRQMDSLDIIHQRLAHNVAGQHPFKVFSIFAIVGQWAVAATLFVDLQFQIGPIAFYVMFWILEVCFILPMGIIHSSNSFFQWASSLVRKCVRQPHAQEQTSANNLRVSMSNEQQATHANWQATVMMNPLCHESALSAETSVAEGNISDARTARETNSRHEDGQANETEVLFTRPENTTPSLSCTIEQAGAHTIQPE